MDVNGNISQKDTANFIGVGGMITAIRTRFCVAQQPKWELLKQWGA
jgi:hypothetical protein